MEGAVQRRFRLGHSLGLFGVFVSLLTLTLGSVNAPRTIAFGTSEISTLSNQYRSSAGLALFTTSPTLTSSAQAKADHMAANNYFAHDAPDGTSPWYFFDQSGYSYTTAGENLALTNQSASSVVDGWYNSPGHRANMLSADFTEVGYGISFVTSFTYNGTTYANVYLVAAHYGKPTVSSASSTATPTSSANTQPTNTIPESVVETPQSVATPATVEPAATNPTQPVNTDKNMNHEPVAGTTDPISGNVTSGTLALGTKEQPRLSKEFAYVGIALGVLFVVAGIAIEGRRLLHHQPLLPHHK